MYNRYKIHMKEKEQNYPNIYLSAYFNLKFWKQLLDSLHVMTVFPRGISLADKQFQMYICSMA